MDQLGRIESKIDALLEAQSVTWEEPQPEPPPEPTQAQKDAMANAPVVAVPPPPGEPTSEEAQQQALANAPTVKVPGQEGAAEGDIASVTVETEQPDGSTDVTSVPPSVPRRR